uniref:hypothetical protein n=1 Tax=Rheinheimera sp. TaxID=1869214 RepID=UPI004047D32C
MEMLKTFDLSEKLHEGIVNLNDLLQIVTEAQNIMRLYNSLLSFNHTKNVTLFARLDSSTQLHICAQNSNEATENGNLYESDDVVIQKMLRKSITHLGNEYSHFLSQISRDEIVHLNSGFSNVLKSLKKIDNDETLVVGSEVIELPKIDHSLFANMIFEAPLKGLGTAEILDFNTFSIFITADPLDGRKFEKIRVSFTQEQLNKILDFHYQGCKLHGEYEVKKIGSAYKLVNFEVNPMIT